MLISEKMTGSIFIFILFYFIFFFIYLFIYFFASKEAYPIVLEKITVKNRKKN